MSFIKSRRPPSPKSSFDVSLRSIPPAPPPPGSCAAGNWGSPVNGALSTLRNHVGRAACWELFVSFLILRVQLSGSEADQRLVQRGHWAQPWEGTVCPGLGAAAGTCGLSDQTQAALTWARLGFSQRKLPDVPFHLITLCARDCARGWR